MKRISLFLFSLAFLFACSACGDLSEQKEPLREQTDNLTEEYQEPTQPGNDVVAPEKIVLEGQSVLWDEFPMPSAEVFSLTGEDAVVYNAITEVYNPKTYAEHSFNPQMKLEISAFPPLIFTSRYLTKTEIRPTTGSSISMTFTI